MASLQELNLSNKPLGDQTPSFDELPAERGSFTPPPQPGSFRFALPATINNFEPVTTKDYGERINVVFDASAPLVIKQSPGKAHDGETFETRLSNVPRKRGKEGILVSDLDYVIKALQEQHKQPLAKPKSNLQYAQALQKFAGSELGADIEWSWRCNPRRAARFLAEDGSLVTQEDPASTLEGDDAGLQAGCGTGHYQNDVQKVDGEYPLYITCSTCGAQVRAFANLRNFKP